MKSLLSSKNLKLLLALEVERALRHRRAKEHSLRQLFWECTQRCNLKCRHCGSDCKASSMAPDMPSADFLRVVDSIIPHVDRHRLNIVITGGEPLMRDDIEAVGLQLYRRELPWGIVTNGMLLTPVRWQRLIAAGIHNITISLDGLEKSHNWMRGNELSFKRAMEAIRLVARTPAVNFDVVTCVNQHSLHELESIGRLLDDAGVKRWRLFTIFPSGRARNYSEFNLNRDEFVYLMEFIRNLRRSGGIQPSYCCEGFLGRYEGKVRGRLFYCAAGISVGSVLIDGSISACPSIRADYVQGNIYRDDFMDVWNNRFEKYRERAWLRTGFCADCKMFRYCEGNGMHLREDDGTIKHCYYHSAQL